MSTKRDTTPRKDPVASVSLGNSNGVKSSFTSVLSDIRTGTNSGTHSTSSPMTAGQPASLQQFSFKNKGVTAWGVPTPPAKDIPKTAANDFGSLEKKTGSKPNGPTVTNEQHHAAPNTALPQHPHSDMKKEEAPQAKVETPRASNGLLEKATSSQPKPAGGVPLAPVKAIVEKRPSATQNPGESAVPNTVAAEDAVAPNKKSVSAAPDVALDGVENSTATATAAAVCENTKFDQILEFLEAEKAAREKADKKQKQDNEEILRRLAHIEVESKEKQENEEILRRLTKLEADLVERKHAQDAKEKTLAERERVAIERERAVMEQEKAATAKGKAIDKEGERLERDSQLLATKVQQLEQKAQRVDQMIAVLKSQQENDTPEASTTSKLEGPSKSTKEVLTNGGDTKITDQALSKNQKDAPDGTAATKVSQETRKNTHILTGSSSKPIIKLGKLRKLLPPETAFLEANSLKKGQLVLRTPEKSSSDAKIVHQEATKQIEKVLHQYKVSTPDFQHHALMIKDLLFFHEASSTGWNFTFLNGNVKPAVLAFVNDGLGCWLLQEHNWLDYETVAKCHDAMRNIESILRLQQLLPDMQEELKRLKKSDSADEGDAWRETFEEQCQTFYEYGDALYKLRITVPKEIPAYSQLCARERSECKRLRGLINDVGRKVGIEI